MTTQEMISVMQAYVDGKTIEYKFKGCNVWDEFNKNTMRSPLWLWREYDYRIKQEPKEPTYRPYANFVEFRAEWEKHGGWVIDKSTCKYRIVNTFDIDCANALLTNYAWLDDDTPCGIKVED